MLRKRMYTEEKKTKKLGPYTFEIGGFVLPVRRALPAMMFAKFSFPFRVISFSGSKVLLSGDASLTYDKAKDSYFIKQDGSNAEFLSMTITTKGPVE